MRCEKSIIDIQYINKLKILIYFDIKKTLTILYKIILIFYLIIIWIYLKYNSSKKDRNLYYIKLEGDPKIINVKNITQKAFFNKFQQLIIKKNVLIESKKDVLDEITERNSLLVYLKIFFDAIFTGIKKEGAK